MNIIDFHSHVLPQLDDGSHSTEESLAMLSAEKSSGILTVAATPHFYPDAETPSDFLARRQTAFSLLKKHLGKNTPEILLGAEVAYFEGMKNCRELKDLAIEKAGLLLVEMPMAEWTERMLSDVLFLSDSIGFPPLLAHIDRYPLSHEEMLLVRSFVKSGGMVQANASAFLHFTTCGKMIRLINSGIVHLLGSDCHNTVSRPPNLGTAVEKIKKKAGMTPIRLIEAAQNKVFSC